MKPEVPDGTDTACMRVFQVMRNVSKSYELIKKYQSKQLKDDLNSEKKNDIKNKIQITPTAYHTHKVNVIRPHLRHFCYNMIFKFIILHRKKN